MRIGLSILICIFMFSFSATSQYTITATVIDSSTNEGLMYCNIYDMKTGNGCITNEEGKFELDVGSLSDTIRISYIGYHTVQLSAQKINGLKKIKLTPKTINIQEFTVYADNDYAFELIQKCRKRLKSNRPVHTAKAYYGIQTSSNNQPLELLECYYNADIIGENIKSLKFKAGRTGLAMVDNGYFQTYSSAKAISKLALMNKTDYYPGNPLQFGKSKLKRLYQLNVFTLDTNILLIKFSPKTKMDELFGGEIWMNSNTNELLKINLVAKETSKHPFEAKHASHSISEVNLQITNTYSKQNGQIVIDHLNFEYSFNYHSLWGTNDSSNNNRQRDIQREIKSKGIISLYDYDQAFIIPYFEYPDNLYYGDYQRMEFLPYNAYFWNSNNQVLLTEDQKENLGFFAEKGRLTNYWDEEKGLSTLEEMPIEYKSKDELFEFNYIYWRPDKRIILKNIISKDKIENIETRKTNTNSTEYQVIVDNVDQGVMSVSTFNKDRYKLKCQLFLDITRIGDSLHCESHTVFDNYKSYFAIEEDKNTNAFLNIFFDICEIERRKMQGKLKDHNNSLETINFIYDSANEQMIQTTNMYFEEVAIGKNQWQMKKWNQYVYDHLNIDNLKLVENTLEFRE